MATNSFLGENRVFNCQTCRERIGSGWRHFDSFRKIKKKNKIEFDHPDAFEGLQNDP